MYAGVSKIVQHPPARLRLPYAPPRPSPRAVRLPREERYVQRSRWRVIEDSKPLTLGMYDEITKVFDTFKENLARVMASMLKEGQEKEVRDAYKRGFNNGKMETQKEMIEDAKKYSIGDMFRKHVAGGV